MPATTLDTRTLGKSGIEVTSMGIGLWAIGGSSWGPVEDQHSRDTIDAALDAGITFFDTADVYGDGHSEEILGDMMKGRRDKFIVGSKIGWMGFDGDNQRSAYDSVEKLVAGVESNLRRLQTDYLDVIQNHINFQEAHMEIFLEGFQRLQRDGKVRAYGVSTRELDYIKAFNAGDGMATLQIDYSILNRTPETDVFPYCQENGIGIIVRGPLAMGLLTGKFSADSQFPAGDFRQDWQNDPEQHTQFLQDLAAAEKLQPLAAGKTMAQLALQFALGHPAVTTVIPGAKTVQQLNDNVGAALLPPLSAEDMAQIDTIVPRGGGRTIWPA